MEYHNAVMQKDQVKSSQIHDKVSNMFSKQYLDKDHSNSIVQQYLRQNVQFATENQI